MEETKLLLERAHLGDNEARSILVEKNLGLVHHIVKRFIGRGADQEDLFQIGCIGLIKAIDKFDLSFDVKFSTYAVPMISGEIKRFLRDDGMVKVSRSLKENSWKAKRAAEELGQKLGREATIDEISKCIDIPAADIVLALEATVTVESIHKSIYQSDGNEVFLLDLVGEDGESDKVLDHMLLEQVLKSLGEDERYLIKLRYFENMTQVQVAKLLGISQVQVSRNEKKVLMQMRQFVLN
ncbi:MAG: SigB/SigF/SigG family RNA polymerase sigma factor [Lachnospiraceae bacterium]